jgi:hypothetical protein
MKKVFFIALIALFGLSACVPDFLNSGAQDAPPEAVDIAATVDAAASTQAVQTFEALPTPTMEDPTAEPPMDEATATLTETATPSETPTVEASETPDGTLPAETATETPDGTLPAETATEVLDVTPEATGTVEITATSPVSINEPPASVPRFKIKVRNNTKVRTFISLHGSTEGGYKPIIEYDLAPWQKVKIVVPEGYYTIIVYVGSDPIYGHVAVHSNNTVEITINKTDLKIVK